MSDKHKLIKLSDDVLWWVDDRAVKVAFHPRGRNGGHFMPEFDFYCLLDGRRITDTGLARIMNADFYNMDKRYTTDQVRSALLKWVWECYLEQQEYPAAFLAMPRVVIKRPNGRPRKDGTSHTVTIEVDVNKPTMEAAMNGHPS